jgi:hypothetical protein
VSMLSVHLLGEGEGEGFRYCQVWQEGVFIVIVIVCGGHVVGGNDGWEGPINQVCTAMWHKELEPRWGGWCGVAMQMTALRAMVVEARSSLVMPYAGS